MQANFQFKPLHQIQVGDEIAYYQRELVTPTKGYREGLYQATVVEKIPYTLRLTTGELRGQALYRVVVPTPVEKTPQLASREQSRSFGKYRVSID